MNGSVQRIALERPVVEPGLDGAVALADAYWSEIQRVTAGLVRARRTQGGVELRLARIALFRFGRPRTTAVDGAVEARFPIVGGLLAKGEGGSLVFLQGAQPPELVVSVEGYVPRLSSTRGRWSLRRFVYRQVQERAHVAIGRRYLARMAARSL